MTFYEKLVEKAKEMGYQSATKFFDAAEVNTNARQALKKTGRLSDTYKMRCARVLKCSVGDINAMMSEARAEELKEMWPDKTKKAKPKPPKDEPVHILEEETIGEFVPVETVEEQQAQEPEAVTEEQESAPEKLDAEETTAPEQSEDDVLDEKIESIKLAADELLTYHDRIKEAAKNTLAEQYAAMLREKMLEVAMADLTALCHEFLDSQDAHKAMAFVDVSLEIVKLKENV